MVRQTRTWESKEALLSNLISPINQEAGSDNERLADAIQLGAYAEWTTFFTDLSVEVARQTMTTFRLKGLLAGLGVPSAGVTDVEVLRSLLASRIAVMWNDSTASGVIATAVAITGLAASDFTYTENVENGTYSPNYAELEFSADALLLVGIDAEDISTITDEVTEAVNEVAPAGSRINTVLTGGAVWDDAAAIWDDPDTIWSG